MNTKKENFSWYIEHIKYATINVGTQNFERIDLPEFVKNKIYNDTLSCSFIIWRLEKEKLFGIKYANKEITIILDTDDKFFYFQHSEKGQINSGSIYLKKERGEKKFIVSGNYDLLNKLYSVLKIWFGDRVEYLNSND